MIETEKSDDFKVLLSIKIYFVWVLILLNPFKN